MIDYLNEKYSVTDVMDSIIEFENNIALSQANDSKLPISFAFSLQM